MAVLKRSIETYQETRRFDRRRPGEIEMVSSAHRSRPSEGFVERKTITDASGALNVPSMETDKALRVLEGHWEAELDEAVEVEEE